MRLKRAPRYTPVSKRQDKPDAVYWLLRNHPEFADADIIKLIGTTKATIQKIRERSHWNATNIKAVDPVTLGLCSQLELDLAVSRADAKLERAAEARRQERRDAEADCAKPPAPPRRWNCRAAPAEAAVGEGAPAPDDYDAVAANSSRIRRKIAQADECPARPRPETATSATSRYFSSSALALFAEEMHQHRLRSRCSGWCG